VIRVGLIQSRSSSIWCAVISPIHDSRSCRSARLPDPQMSALRISHSVSYPLTQRPMQPNNITTKNRIYAPIIIGFSLLIIIFWIYPLYTSYTDTSVEIASLSKSVSDKTGQINTIKNMQERFAGSGSDDLKVKVQKYKNAYSTSDIISTVMLNKFTESSTFTPAMINIWSINVNPGRVLPNGLSLATVSLSITAGDPKQIIDYLTYLVNESAYAFTIDAISLPLDTATDTASTTGITLSINLGVYYYK